MPASLFLEKYVKLRTIRLKYKKDEKYVLVNM